MRTFLAIPTRLFVITGVAVGLGLAAAQWRSNQFDGAAPTASTSAIAEAPPAYFEKAFACLTLGDSNRTLDSLSTESLEALAHSLAFTLHAYEQGSFDSYIAARRNDIEFATDAKANDVAELVGLLPVPTERNEETPKMWVPALRSYWRTINSTPPVETFQIEASVCDRGLLNLDPVAIEAWEAEFNQTVAQLGSYIHLFPSVPHRRSIAELAIDKAELTYVDLQLPFTSRFQVSGMLILRLVLDDDSEWFIHRAAAICVWNASSDSHPCPLIV
ncbi:MAG: hypothetical protein ACI8TQ_000556 [Planctomycetota bacterium]|jgi:hypothetical protein